MRPRTDRMVWSYIAARLAGVSLDAATTTGVPSTTPLRWVNVPTATATSRAVRWIACQRRRPAPAATGASAVPVNSTVSVAGASTVTSYRATSETAYSPKTAVAGWVCQPAPRSQASNGWPVPHQAVRPVVPQRSNAAPPSVSVKSSVAVTASPGGIWWARGIRSTVPGVPGAAPPRSTVNCVAVPAHTLCTTSRVPAGALGRFGHSRNTSSVIGTSGVKTTVSLPVTARRAASRLNRRVMRGRAGSGSA
jgi:hypothetical protein